MGQAKLYGVRRTFSISLPDETPYPTGWKAQLLLGDYLIGEAEIPSDGYVQGLYPGDIYILGEQF